MTRDNFDIENTPALLAYLRRAGRIDDHEEPLVHVLTGGVSNRTVLLERPSGESWVIKQALAKLRVAADWFSDPQRIHREALGLRWLNQLAPPGSTVEFLFEDHVHHLLAMTAVPQPHQNWKIMLLAGDLQTPHVEQFAELLGTIHARAADRAAQLAPLFDDRSFFESLRLEPYYQYTAEQVESVASFLNQLVQSCRSRRFTLVHGDFSPKNILVYSDPPHPPLAKGGRGEDRLILLDHEVIHWGDPAFDLGFAFTHLLSKAHHLPPHRERFAEAAAQFWQVYSHIVAGVSWFAGLEEQAVRHTLGCLLARVKGRSPLEYLDESERVRQHEAVMKLMTFPPITIRALIDRFLIELG